MLTKQEFVGVVEHLTGDDLSLRVAALKDLWHYPSSDERILPYLEQFLHDKTTCIIARPYLFAEVRWLAANALAAERKALAIDQVVELQHVVRPLDMRTYNKARKAANISFRVGVEGVLENLSILRDMGYLPMYDLLLSPQPRAKKEKRAIAAPPVLMPVPAL